MRFAKNVFRIAGILGIITLIPLYFLRESIGEQYPPAITHPDFYYGFIALALVWQIAFLVIAKDPIRLRPMMIPAMLEKFGFVSTIVVLYLQGALQRGQVAPVVPDFILGILFVMAYIKTPSDRGPGIPV
jgi:hypothetical protein